MRAKFIAKDRAPHSQKELTAGTSQKAPAVKATTAVKDVRKMACPDASRAEGRFFPLFT